MWQGSSRAQHLYLMDLIAQLHPDLYREYGAELFCLLNANGSSQKWIKPAANSPFDEFEEWSRRRIARLEKDTHKWWEASVKAGKQLHASEDEKNRIWREKNELEAALRELAKKSEGRS